MTFIQPARPGQWGGFSTPAVQNKVIISGSFNNYGGGGFGVPSMPIGGGMMMGGCTMDYGCCNGGMKPFWGGFLGGFLGSVLNYCGFGGGGGASAVSYGAGYPGGITGGAAQLPGSDGLDGLREVYPDNKFSKIGNSYVCVTKDGKQITGRSPEDLLNKLGNGTTDASATKTLTGDARATALKELNEEANKFNETNGANGFKLAVNDNPNGDKSKGTDLQYTLTYTDSKGKTHTSEFRTVPTPGELKSLKDGIEAKINGNSGADDSVKGEGDDVSEPNGTDPNNANKGAVSPKSDFENVINFSKIPGYTYQDGKGVVGPDGTIYKTPADLLGHLTGGNTPVAAKDFDISTLEGQNIIAHDAGKPSDITGDVSVDSDKNTITINGHTYNIVQNSGDFIYFTDPTAKGADANSKGQTYILEKAPGGGYRLSQYDFTKKTDGYDIAAHGN